jgi:serine/threonine protein kinase
MPRAGEQIGPYTLVNKLGRGAFGVVWLAERRTQITTTNAALKIPLDDDIDLNEIKQEADLWVRASGHPNVLPIIEADIYDDQIIIASEYAPDGSLTAWLNKRGGKAPNIETAVEIVCGILAGLEHLHARNIIHRDLKPANILFQSDTPRLADFGISRVLKSTSQSSIVAGTPAYMAPEAFDGKRNEQTDVWSIGVIFYLLLAGRLPFPQADITSLVGAILTRNPEPLPLSVPAPYQEIIARALAKDPRQRFKSAAEMRAALRNPRETNPNIERERNTFTARPSPANTIPPQSFHSQPEKKSNAPRLIYAVTGLLAVFIVVVGIILLTQFGKSSNNAAEIFTNQAPNSSMIRDSARAISKPTISTPRCLISNPSGSCWTNNPPTSSSCAGLNTPKPSANISSDGLSCTLIIPANVKQGTKAEDSSGRQLRLKKGDEFEVESEGNVGFSSDHPCVTPEGMRGWHDPYVDSPFTQNVGGLEFSISSLQSDRYFAGSYYRGRSETDGVPIFRVIDRLTGYNGIGSFRVTVRKLANVGSNKPSSSTREINSKADNPSPINIPLDKYTSANWSEGGPEIDIMNDRPPYLWAAGAGHITFQPSLPETKKSLVITAHLSSELNNRTSTNSSDSSDVILVVNGQEQGMQNVIPDNLIGIEYQWVVPNDALQAGKNEITFKVGKGRYKNGLAIYRPIQLRFQ